MLRKFNYVKVATVREAVRALQTEGVCLHAGGSDLVTCLREGIMSATTVVSIGGIEELRLIEALPDGGLRIGALATLTAITRHPVVAEKYAALAQAAAAVGSPQLRNQGTIGGNLCQRPRCWYFRRGFACARQGGEICFAADGQNQGHAIFGGERCVVLHPSDTAPALVALDAILRIAGPKGVRNLPVESFFVLPRQDVRRENVLAPGEFVTHILLPPPAPSTRSSYRKVRERGAWDFALASLAIAIQVQDGRATKVRMALGGVAPIPWRAKDAEGALVGQSLDEATAQAAAAAAVKDAQPLALNAYKIPLVTGIVVESLLALGGPA